MRRLLERESQLEALAEYAREASRGQGRMVLVSGEAGVGKSSLVEQLESDLVDARWYWGACDGLFTPRPLGPVLDIANRLGGDLLELCRAGAPREELFAALLHEITEPGVLRVFVIEDVHWADEATLDLLRFLGRRLRDASSLLVVSYRDEGLAPGDPLRVALGELATQRTTRRLSLPPLTAAAVAVMADGTALEPVKLYELTGGNPFYLTEILEQGFGELPTSARDAVLAHVTRLSDEARQVLDAAALIGSRVEPALLGAVCDASPENVDELLACGVLTGDGDLLRFRHEIARLAVEQAIGLHRRAPIHSAILAALLGSRCDDEARLAFHAEGAGDRDQVLTHAPLAGLRASELSSHREAAAQYQRALRFATGTDTRTRATLYDRLGHELSLVDRWQESADAREEALALWRAEGDRVREGETLGMLARALWRLCRGAEAHLAAEESLAVLQPLGPSVELARALVSLAGTRMGQSEQAEAIELAQRAIAMAEPLGLYDVLSDALNTEGCAVADTGGDWQGPLDRALDIAVSHSLPVQAGRSYANIYALFSAELRFPEGERYFLDGVAYCEKQDISTYGTCLRGQRAAVLARTGRWAEASALSEQLLAETGPSIINRLNPMMALGSVRARTGEAGAEECLDEVSGLADTLEEPPWVASVRLARAEAYWLAGDLAAAEREITVAEAAAESCDAFLRSEVAVWQHRLGGAVHGDGRLVEPFAAEVAGDCAGAAKQWDELGCPYDAALALMDSTDEALLREALTRLDGLGAVPAARLARQRMRDLGLRSIPTGARATTREHPAGLTPRERDVLELICAGHTNEEISDRLFISVKTVDHHVSAVLGKLGVGSRRVAAAEAVRRGLVGAAT